MASPNGGIKMQPAYHGKPVSTPSATKQSDYINKTFKVEKSPYGTTYIPKPQSQAKPKYPSETDAGSMVGYGKSIGAHPQK